MHPPAPCGAGHYVEMLIRAELDFNPPAPCGAGLLLPREKSTGQTISIHPPHAGRDPAGLLALSPALVFQSTRPMRGGTVAALIAANQAMISIHPPRAGRDLTIPKLSSHFRISIHPPRAGRDLMPAPPHHHRANFNPPAPCGAGPHGHCRPGGTAPISIHPPRAGRDAFAKLRSVAIKRFQSTRPVRGGTFRRRCCPAGQA